MAPALARRFDEGGPTLEMIGEDRLLARLRALAGAGPDDDAAIWGPAPGTDVVVSQDCLVEGVDFRRQWLRPWQLGRRALHAALSDLAGMGARPGYALATLCAPARTELEDVLALQEGLCAAAGETACPLLGGDVSECPGPLVVDVSVGGTVAPGQVLRRSSGRPDQVLVVTGSLGAAAAGLELLRRAGPAAWAGDAPASRWLAAQLEPVARLREGQALVAGGVRCGGDISDGLLVEAGRIAAASGCAAEVWVDRIPVEAALRERLPGSWRDHALGGGEDFELVAAVDRRQLDGLLESWPEGLVPLTVVGRLGEGRGVAVLSAPNGAPVDAAPPASRHFR